MMFSDASKFFAVLIKNKRIMGIDFGGRNVGIAFSDRSHTISTPYLIYTRRNIRKDMGFINALFCEQDSTAIVIGFPECTSEKDQGWTEQIVSFANKLSKKYGINIYLQDESLSTREAYECLDGMSETKIEKYSDKVAASCILQRTLDIMKNNF